MVDMVLDKFLRKYAHLIRRFGNDWVTYYPMYEEFLQVCAADVTNHYFELQEQLKNPKRKANKKRWPNNTK